MQYENARDILTASLLKEVQKYAEGKVIYIPKRSKREGWGEASGYYSNAGLGEDWVRIYLESMGVKVPDSDSYFLSELVRIPLRLIDDENEKPFVTDRENCTEVPLIILFEDRRFHILCRSDYLLMLRKEKKNAHYAFIFAKNEEYEYYLYNFGKQFQA
ncbi:MAG: hypothetical protein K5686_11595 [Lachnospiraceae bacterium]|nr:hypothetical protein [Lachnospiraceae bacterium]